MLYQYTEKEIKKILKTMVIIHDTREQNNGHIIKWLDAHKVAHQEQALAFGDYTCMIPKNEEFAIARDLYFNNIFSIERKGSLEELSGNLTADRDRIKHEFARKVGRMYLMIEGASYEDIVEKRYNTGYNEKAFLAAISSIESKYNVSTHFIKKDYAGIFIYDKMYYFVRNYLLGNV